MRVLLAAVNAKYIHANLAVLYLREVTGDLPAETIIGEYTINMRKEEILEDIYRKHPDIICFSCYIWNRNMIAGLIRDLRRILPEVPIWAGGPDVTYEAESFLEQFPECTGVMERRICPEFRDWSSAMRPEGFTGTRRRCRWPWMTSRLCTVRSWITAGHVLPQIIFPAVSCSTRRKRSARSSRSA